MNTIAKPRYKVLTWIDNPSVEGGVHVFRLDNGPIFGWPETVHVMTDLLFNPEWALVHTPPHALGGGTVECVHRCWCDEGSYYEPGFGLMRGCPVHDG